MVGYLRFVASQIDRFEPMQLLLVGALKDGLNGKNQHFLQDVKEYSVRASVFVENIAEVGGLLRIRRWHFELLSKRSCVELHTS